jgi:predicted lipid-binding transport protein (Tim44 family)
MKTFLTLLMASAFVGALVIPDAQAARVGGGRSMGMQRSVTPPSRIAPPQQVAPATKPAPQPAAAATGNRWLGPIAGIAAGLGLGWLISQGAFGGAMGGVVLALLGGLVLFALLRVYSRRNEAAQPMQYAGLGQQPAQMPSASPGNDFGGGLQPLAPLPSAAPAVQPNVPAGFDVAGFVKQAKLNFLRLQEANDRGDLETLRDVCNDEMFASLQADIAARKHAPQHTEIEAFDATLIEVVTEGDYHLASLSFSGFSREDGGAAPQQFQEIWHLQKPVSGVSGWQLAGIQQVS